jgi:hypothetical protein
MDTMFHMMLGHGLLFHLERKDIATALVDREALHNVHRAQGARIDIEAATTTTTTATITSTTTTITMTTTTITTATDNLAALIAIHLHP